VSESAKSKDGTKVPMTILRKRGTRFDGDNPTVLTCSGGDGISLKPSFDVSRRVWFDQGGIIAISHPRGGGEKGEAWHRAGVLTNKQNGFDDFAACAEFLIESKHTTPERLAIQGAGHGGLVMGALLTQRPDLARAVVSQVGIYDLLRVERDPHGGFNTAEFGSVKDPVQFTALHAFSPYHRVREGTNYPAVLLLAGEHDGRVNPAQSRKMTARLQAASASKWPVLLRTSATSGHGRGLAFSEQIRALADAYSFLLEQLGVSYTVIERGPWSGGVTDSSAVVKARLQDQCLRVRLVVSDKDSLEKPRIYGPVVTEESSYNIATFEATGLRPGTQYFYALEVDGRRDRARRGEFKTFPPEGQPASFKFAWATCGRTASTNASYDRIRENRPLMYLNCGDFHYLDIKTNSRAVFRAAYDTVLASVQQADLYRAIPFDYIWDDHDFGGNNVGKKSTTKAAASLTYQEYVPHYPLAEGQGIVSPYHSFTIGRVKFIVTDLRSERDDDKKKDDANKSMMGAKQKEWFKQELLAAKGRCPLICWVSSVPWLGVTGTNYYPLGTNRHGFIHHTNLVELYKKNRKPSGDQEHWCAYATERREIADFIKSNHISGVCILHGDSHMLAADDGTNGDFATGGGAPIPVMCAAPLDQNPSLKGGPYSQGVYRVRPGEGCFGLLEVEDKGDVVEVRYSGRNNRNEEKISLRFNVPASKLSGQ
jgi:phosphodiesterase/alkaline phosphatase D-like protein